MNFNIKDLMDKIDSKKLLEVRQKVEGKNYEVDKLGLKVVYSLKKELISLDFNPSPEAKLDLNANQLKQISISIHKSITELFAQMLQSEKNLAQKLLKEDNISDSQMKYIQDDQGNIVIQVKLEGIFIEISLKKDFHKTTFDAKYFSITEAQAEALSELMKSVLLSILENMKTVELQIAKEMFSL